VVAREAPRVNVVDLVDVDARTDPRWQDLVARAGGSLFHGSAWASVLADTYRFEPRALLALDGDRAVNGVPWCQVDDPGGARILSLPFSDYGGPIGEPPFAPLLQQLADRRLPVRHRVVVDADSPDDQELDEFVTTDRARWHGIPVTGTPELDAWPELTSAARRAVAKARREGVVVVERPDAAFVPQFLRLHLCVRKHKYRLLPQPLTFFESMRTRFAATAAWHPLTAVQDGELLAATVYLRHGDTLFYKFNASDPSGLGARPNDLLLWSGIELAARLGCTLVDLGVSDDDQPGLIRFKRGFGAVEREVRTRAAGWHPTADAERFQSVLSEVTRRLTAPDVHDQATAIAGALLYRYFA
jgi:CelD/BcsL family acetyltransferase involved in cellulose biosynthesis